MFDNGDVHTIESIPLAFFDDTLPYCILTNQKTTQKKFTMQKCQQNFSQCLNDDFFLIAINAHLGWNATTEIKIKH